MAGNLSPRGVWARALDAGLGAPSPLLEAWATLPGSNIPQSVIEVWCSNAAGVPVLVWARDAAAPTGVAAVYNAATQTVTLTWTLPSTVKADSYRIVRPDGTTPPGFIPGTATSFTDPSPVGWNGVYTVRAYLGDSTANAFSNSLALGNPVQGLSATWVASPTWGPRLSWSHPTYGRPTTYRVYISNTGTGNWQLVEELPGNVTTVTYPSQPPSSTLYYQVRPVIQGSEGAGSQVIQTSSTRGTATPVVTGSRPQEGLIRIAWATPAYGTPDSYRVYRDGVFVGSLPGTATSSDTPTDYGIVRAYTVEAVYNGVGAFNSDPPVLFATRPAHPENLSIVRFWRGGNGDGQITWTDGPGYHRHYRVTIRQNGSPILITDTFNNYLNVSSMPISQFMSVQVAAYSDYTLGYSPLAYTNNFDFRLADSTPVTGLYEAND